METDDICNVNNTGIVESIERVNEERPLDERINDTIFENQIFNIVMYVLLVVVIIFVIWIEYKAQFCPMGTSMSECKPNQYNSAVLSGTIAEPTDSFDVIIGKTIRAAAHDMYAIKWRTALVLSFFIALFFWFLVFGRLPRWHRFYLTVLISFIILYVYGNFSAFHFNALAVDVVEYNLSLLGR